MTARTCLVVLGALARAVPRGPFLVGAGAALLAVGAAGALATPRVGTLALQASTVALAGAAVALLAEPRALLDAMPTSRARRRALLLAAGLPALALEWALLLRIAGAGGADAAALSLQLTAVTAVALGLGAREGADPAHAVAGVAVAFGAGRVLLGPDLFPAGTEAAHWSGARGWWAAAACAGLLLLVAHSRDAAAPPIRR